MLVAYFLSLRRADSRYGGKQIFYSHFTLKSECDFVLFSRILKNFAKKVVQNPFFLPIHMKAVISGFQKT